MTDPCFAQIGTGFTNDQGDKTGVSSQELAPAGIILDAELTLATPERLWLSTGLRALDHAVGTCVHFGSSASHSRWRLSCREFVPPDRPHSHQVPLLRRHRRIVHVLAEVEGEPPRYRFATEAPGSCLDVPLAAQGRETHVCCPIRILYSGALGSLQCPWIVSLPRSQARCEVRHPARDYLCKRQRALFCLVLWY